MSVNGSEPDEGDGEGDAPLTRREMKARGIVLTTEIPVVLATPENPVIGPIDVAVAAAPAVHANRATRDRFEVERAVTGAGIAAGVPAPSAPDDDAPTSTGRRPVIRAPLTARGIRTVDESGEITSVQAAVGRAVEASTSPASWESAVALPAVALGIEDMAGRAAEAAPIEPPHEWSEAPGQPHPDVDADQHAPTVARPASASVPESSGSETPAAPPPASAAGRTAGGSASAAPVPASASPVEPLSTPPAQPAPAPRTVLEAGTPASLEPPPRHDPRRARLRVAVILAVLVALVVLSYLIFTRAFDGGATGGDAGALAGVAAPVAVLPGLAASAPAQEPAAPKGAS